MNIYKSTSRWKTILAILAAFIVLASLIYTNYLVGKIEKIERQKVKLYANTLKKITEAPEGEDVNFYFEIINAEESIPLMAIDENDEILSYRNLDDVKAKDTLWLEKQKRLLRNASTPVEIKQPGGGIHYYLYRGSPLLYQLRWFPFAQLAIIGLFLFTAYYLFNQARRAEQNQVWVGMSKETAHQLGTPISSLLAWIELLRDSKDETVQSILPDMEKDLNRLDLISDRFSKIGSPPMLEKHELQQLLSSTFYYMERRSSKHVRFQLELPEQSIYANIYPPLFNWVLENLIKNALDAIDGNGAIIIRLTEKQHKAKIDVIDTGKGISLRNKHIVFRPGYSTKKRGWGLGLSLSKRIIETYHNGRIYVAHSQKDVGTTFTIELETV